MGLKRSLHQLSDTDVVAPASVEKLRDVGITTVEELIGAADADPRAAARLLDLSQSELTALTSRAREMLDSGTRKALDQSARRKGLGALPPS